MMEQLHVTACGHVPAEVHFHLSLDQSIPVFGLLVVQIQSTLDSGHEVVGIVALEGEAQAALSFPLWLSHFSFWSY